LHLCRPTPLNDTTMSGKLCQYYLNRRIGVNGLSVRGISEAFGIPALPRRNVERRSTDTMFW
ncbi:MAG: hypothetical protein MK165_04965, partial [Pirellulaceae bacterium]|nr:hypothetical protein [Pirellulaceae bacterium]